MRLIFCKGDQQRKNTHRELESQENGKKNTFSKELVQLLVQCAEIIINCSYHTVYKVQLGKC